jgi:Bacteriophage related domain of unknown function
MSMDSMREYVTAEFQTAWGLAFPNVPVQYENLRFAQPSTTAWVSIDILPVDHRRASVGTEKRFIRETGFVSICVYVPENTGTKAASNMIDAACDVFEDRVGALSDGESVSFYAAKKRKTGVKAGFYEITGMVPYRRDACKPSVV